ncbi:hypothetical protein GCM10027448_12350 [Nocardioides dilutus]
MHRPDVRRAEIDRPGARPGTNTAEAQPIAQSEQLVRERVPGGGAASREMTGDGSETEQPDELLRCKFVATAQIHTEPGDSS